MLTNHFLCDSSYVNFDIFHSSTSRFPLGHLLGLYPIHPSSQQCTNKFCHGSQNIYKTKTYQLERGRAHTKKRTFQKGLSKMLSGQKIFSQQLMERHLPPSPTHLLIAPQIQRNPGLFMQYLDFSLVCKYVFCL